MKKSRYEKRHTNLAVFRRFQPHYVERLICVLQLLAEFLVLAEIYSSFQSNMPVHIGWSYRILLFVSRLKLAYQFEKLLSW